jgi:histidyl-tRNA synthetase
MKELNVGPYSLRINSRKLLSALYGAVGVEGDARKSAIIAVDKIFKIGRDGVARELSQIPGISQDAIEKILASTSVQCPISELAARIASLELGGPLVDEGVQELTTICALLPAEMSHVVTIDLSLARGLDYYTGLILEVGLVNYPEFGTVVAGGRYENLTSEFTDQKFPGVGVSIGLGRLMDLLLSEKLVPTERKCPSVALVTVYDEKDRVWCNQVAHELRGLGLSTEVFYKAPKLGKQIEYAEDKGIRYVLFLDSTTRAIKVKDLITKEQAEVSSLADWVASL